MRKSVYWALVATGTAALVASPASAKDDDWSGFYVGVDAGAASTSMHAAATDDIFQLTNIDPPGPEPLTVVPGTTRTLDEQQSHTTFIYGALIGFQLESGMFVFGAEADIHGPRDSAYVSSTQDLPPTAITPDGSVTMARSTRTRYDWSLRAKIGADLGSTLLYAAGGVAGTQMRLMGEDTMTIPAGVAAGCNQNVTPGCIPFNPGTIGPIVATASEQKSMTGWTAGLGIDEKVMPHVSIGLDGRYTDYGSHTLGLAAGCFPNQAAQGQCGNATFTGGTITFPAGTNPASIDPNGADTYPGALPDSTRIALHEWRLAVRLIWRL